MTWIQWVSPGFLDISFILVASNEDTNRMPHNWLYRLRFDNTFNYSHLSTLEEKWSNWQGSEWLGQKLITILALITRNVKLVRQFSKCDSDSNFSALYPLGSRPYPVMATTNTDGHQVSPIPPPTITAVKQASPQLQTSSNRNTPLDSPPTRTGQTPRATEREVHVNKQAQKENIKRKHEESNGINKRAKIQNMPKTDGPKEMLRKLEEARLKDIHDKTELPCEWPRVADGEFILENGEPKIWHCGQCDKSFAQRSLLQMHICARNPNRPYQCGHCSQEFAHPNELRTHAVIHSGKKPFKCGFCSRTFAGATTLNNHVRTHTGERPFTCNKCYKTFSQASQLSKHKRSLYECFPRDKYWFITHPCCSYYTTFCTEETHTLNVLLAAPSFKIL